MITPRYFFEKIHNNPHKQPSLWKKCQSGEKTDYTGINIYMNIISTYRPVNKGVQ